MDVRISDPADSKRWELAKEYDEAISQQLLEDIIEKIFLDVPNDYLPSFDIVETYKRWFVYSKIARVKDLVNELFKNRILNHFNDEDIFKMLEESRDHKNIDSHYQNGKLKQLNNFASEKKDVKEDLLKKFEDISKEEKWESTIAETLKDNREKEIKRETLVFSFRRTNH